MQVIIFGYGFYVPFGKVDIQQLDNAIEELNIDYIKYCWDETLEAFSPNKKIFIFISGCKFDGGRIPYSYHQTDFVKIPSVLPEGGTKNLDYLYSKFVNKNIDFNQISWKFFSYYEK